MGLAPGYEQKHFDSESKRGQLRLVASNDGRDGSVTIHADASIHAGLFDGREHLHRPLDAARKTYVHVVRGAVEVNGHALQGGDALLIENEPALEIGSARDAEVLVFDLH